VTVLELDIGRALVEVDHICGCECVHVKKEVVCWRPGLGETGDSRTIYVVSTAHLLFL
jgi:hypothetical protein